MPAEGIKIVQMQTLSLLQDEFHSKVKVDDFTHIADIALAMKQNAEAELAQAFADGYEITNITVGGNERVLLTVWTLRPGDHPVTVQTFTMDFRDAFMAAKAETDALPGNDPISRMYGNRANLDQRTLKDIPHAD